MDYTKSYINKNKLKVLKGEVIVDVMSALGAYCGSFSCTKQTYNALKFDDFNASSKGHNYFIMRDYQNNADTTNNTSNNSRNNQNRANIKTQKGRDIRWYEKQ